MENKPATQTQTKAVSTAKPPRTIQSLIEGEKFKFAITAALPKHLAPERFIRIALTAVQRTPKLAECDEASFFNALLSLSQLGLEPDGRAAHLIPFFNSKRNCTEVQLIVDWKGYVDLAMRSGTISYIHMDRVCVNDEFLYDRGELKKHTINFKEHRGDPYAYYSLVRNKDGSESCVVMSKFEVDDIRKRSKSSGSGPWVTDYDAMAQKSVFRRHAKRLQLSPELRDAFQAEDDSEDSRVAAAKIVVATPMFERPVTQPAIAAQSEQPAIDLSNEQGTDVPAEPDPDPEPQPMPEELKKPTPKVSSQDELAAIVISGGYTFDNFRAWGKESGNVMNVDDLAGFDEIPTAKAAAFVKAKVGLLKGLAVVVGGVYATT